MSDGCGVPEVVKEAVVVVLADVGANVVVGADVGVDDAMDAELLASWPKRSRRHTLTSLPRDKDGEHAKRGITKRNSHNE
jgi:hypothetical protein